MSTPRPRLVVPTEGSPVDPERLARLREIFDVLEVASVTDAVETAGRSPGALILHPPLPGGNRHATPDHVDLAPADLLAILENIAEGVGVYQAAADGSDTAGFVWANGRLKNAPEGVRRIFASTCRVAVQEFESTAIGQLAPKDRESRKFTFSHGDEHFEAVFSVAAADEATGAVRSVIGILWVITETRRLQTKIDTIDAAGAELLQIDTEAITRLNLAERLHLLEDRITNTVSEILHFDNFEIRLIDRQTGRLELVFLRGLAPLRIGEVLYAEETGNGICGYVAATGRSYLCHDVASDALYHEGLTDAASSLTVPLRLHDQIIGVFNIESNDATAFDENDRRFAEIYGRYIALAMHILDLLVVERFTTNEQLTENVLVELAGPLNTIRSTATALRARARSDRAREDLDHLLASIGDIDRRLDACIKGPKSIIGAEPENDDDDRTDPIFTDKHVLIVDNEPIVLDAIQSLLQRKGCTVTACPSGAEGIETLQTPRDVPFDLVISDIRMGAFNGYEVFRAAKSAHEATPVILMTGFGYDPHHSIVRANQEGLHSFLFKPVKASSLLDAVRSAFAPEPVE